MKTKLNTTSLALWVTRAGGLVVAALLFAMPFILDWYSSVRSLSKAEWLAILIAFYACSVPVLIALWKMDGLLRSLLKAEIFVPKKCTPDPHGAMVLLCGGRDLYSRSLHLLPPVFHGGDHGLPQSGDRCAVPGHG